jgi:hypothetical protein
MNPHSFKDFLMQSRHVHLVNNIDDVQCRKLSPVVLHPGEMLFIPTGWFHFVESLDTDTACGLNIALTFFTRFDGCPDCDVASYSEYATTLPTLRTDKINFSHLKKASRPFVVKDYFMSRPLWSCFRWKHEALANIFQSRMIKVIQSSNNIFVSDHIKSIYPEHNKPVFAKITDFLALRDKPYRNHFYLIQPGMQHVFNDTPFFLHSGDEKATVNIDMLINYGNVVTNLHCDGSDNILLQVAGTKKITLIPPSERHRLNVVNPYSPSFLCSLRETLMKTNS